jgi:hypothetical protein
MSNIPALENDIRRLSEAVQYLIKYITTLSTHTELRAAMTVINQEFSDLAGVVSTLQDAVDNGDLVQYSEGTTPSGLVNGVNNVYTLEHDPIPSASVQLFVDGQFQHQDTDYTINHEVISTITPPGSGVPITAFFKY